jgi:hypothetical protein
MSDTGEVGAAMWGGRHLVSAADETAPEPPRGRVIDRDLVSVVLVCLGVPALSTGAGLLWGVGAAVLALGALLIVVGVLLGLGER